MRKAEGAWTIQTGEDEAQVDIINIHKYLKGGSKENRARLLQVKKQWEESGAQEFPSEYQEAFLCCVGDIAVEKISERGPEVFPLQIFKSHLEMVLNKWI